MNDGRPVLLLTGVTGLLGGAALVHLMTEHPDVRMIVLVRAAADDEARARLTSVFGRFEVPPAAASRVEIVRGDLCDATTLEDGRLDEVTHVLHAAANTSFRSVRGVRKVNLEGTLNLSHRMQRVPSLVRFVHVGTAFSCGLDVDGLGSAGGFRGCLEESSYPRTDARHLVEYTRVKAEVESALRALRPRLPLVIARPSVVVGHSRLGASPSASILWFYRTADLLRRIPWPLETRDDVVPVDWVAEALGQLLLRPKLAFDCYHLSAGRVASSSWSELAACFSRHRTDQPEPYEVTAAEDIERAWDRLAPRLGPGDADRMRMALGYYYRFPTVIFDNTRILAEGIRTPPRFADYLDLCLTRPGHRTVYEQMTDDD